MIRTDTLNRLLEESSPPFPSAALPEPIFSFVGTGSDVSGFPPEMIALPLLAGMAACIGNKRRLKLRDDWQVKPILWIGILAPSGRGKTPAATIALKPLEDLQQIEIINWRRAKEQADEKDPIPPPARFLAGDSTVEALTDLLKTSRGLLQHSDELGSWLLNQNAYKGKGGDRHFYLSLHAGKLALVDRKSEKDQGPVAIPDPVVCLFGGCQPRAFAQLFQAGLSDGLTQRILWAVPNTKPTTWTNKSIPEAFQKQIVGKYARLLNIAEKTITLDPEATREWSAFYDDQQIELHGCHEDESAFRSKMVDYVARLALVLQTIEDDHADQVSLLNLKRAILLIKFHQDSLHSILTILHGKDIQGETRVINYIKRTQNGINVRELYRQLTIKQDRMKIILDSLVSQGIGRIEITKAPNGKQVETFWLN